MGNDWKDDDPPYTGKSEIFKRPEPKPEVAYTFQDQNSRFLIVRDPLIGLGSSTGPVDEHGWPILRAADA